jgi:CRP-like cAMP-binding protein
LKENEAFGDVSAYMTQQPAIKSYQLLEDSILYRIDLTKFRRLFLIDHEICNLGRIIAEQHILFLQKSIKQYNGMTALEKYECFLQDRPDLVFRVKFIYIASYLHMAPETLSRIHSRWLKEKNSSLNISLSEWQTPTGSW